MPTNDQPDKVHAWKTKDPDWGIPDRKGMLLSDQISRFCAQEPGLLIAEGYNESRLRPPAYTLTVGEVYVDSAGKRGRLSDQNASFVMQPNSIVFVSTEELLDLPYYIAARFNIRVDWVYKGILLGTGPQVEPGFRGRLSCPLYNLTNRPHTITRGDEFATIDFERTTNFVDALPANVVAGLERKGKLNIFNSGNSKFLLFDQRKFEALDKYPKDYDIVSSLVQMQQNLEMWRKIGVGIVVSFIALTLSLLGMQNNLLRETIANGKELTQVKDQLTQTQKELRQLQQDLPKNSTSK